MKKKNKKIILNKLPDRFISIALIVIWISLVAFGIISLSNPRWLAETSYENKKEEVSELVREGIWLSKNNKENQAIQKFDEALEKIPDFVEAVINKGVSYKRMKMYDAAISEFMKALEMSPQDSSNTYSNLKDIYLNIGDTAKASEFFQKSIESSYLSIDKLIKKGNFYLSLKELDSALIAYNTALEKRFRIHTYYYDELYRAYKNEPDNQHIYKAIKNYNPEKAKKDIRKYYDKKCFELNLYTDKGLAENYNQIGYVIALMGEYNKALEYFKMSVNVWKDYKEAHGNIRYINEKLRNQKLSN
jgi:tetratricopeptide (TPR) repeat protein